MRQDLQALAKLANAPPPSSAPSAPLPYPVSSVNSSGFVDLAALQDGDGDDWVERELARRARRAQGPAVLTPGSMAPVAMAALLPTTDAGGTRSSQATRGRSRVYSALGVVGVAVVAVLSVAVARNAPSRSHGTPQANAVAAVGVTPPPSPAVAATPVVATTTPAPSSAATSSAAAAAPIVSAQNAPVALETAPKKGHAARARAAAAAPRPPPPPPAAHTAVAAAAPPATPAAVAAAPAPKGGGSDPLMDLIRASVAQKK